MCLYQLLTSIYRQMAAARHFADFVTAFIEGMACRDIPELPIRQFGEQGIFERRFFFDLQRDFAECFNRQRYYRNIVADGDDTNINGVDRQFLPLSAALASR